MIFDIAALAEGFHMVLDPLGLCLAMLGVIFGTVLGMIPGLTGSVCIAIMLPLTFYMSPFHVMTLLLGIYTGGIYGGSITAILVNTPGAPAAVCTAMDGYPLNKQGKGLFALYLAMFSSVVGGLIGVFVLILSINTFGQIVLKFGSSEMFAVVFLALSIIATIRPESPSKTLFGGFLGVVFGLIGYSATGMPRGTMGSVYLLSGVPFIPTLVGMFALSEALSMVEETFIVSEKDRQALEGQKKFPQMRAAIKTVFSQPLNVIRSSLLGVFIGALPAAGASAATVVAYGEAKRSSKHPELYGKGSLEGIVASETSNNACEGGAMATTFLVGVPGSAVGAMILSALYLQGWVAGPRMFIDYKSVMYGVLDMMMLEQFMLIPAGLLVIFMTYRIIKLPNSIIAPLLIVMSCVGAFSYRSAMFDVGVMIFFGVLAFVMQKMDFATVSFILGLLLGSMVDEQVIRIGQRFGDYSVIFTRPISCGFMIVTLLALARTFYREYKKNKKIAAAP